MYFFLQTIFRISTFLHKNKYYDGNQILHTPDMSIYLQSMLSLYSNQIVSISHVSAATCSMY